MRAVVITQSGGPDVLQVRDVPRPEPLGRQVLVRVHAAALNRADLLQRRGRYAVPNDAPREIPGIEFAGEVAACGTDARRWHDGDRVCAIASGGAQAQYVVVHEDTLIPVPASLDWIDAAAVPEAFITAWDALVLQAAVRRGETVLVHAAGSGVGLATLQVARAWKAIPYGTTRTESKLTRARALGLEDGVVLHGELGPLVPAVQRWTSERGIDVIMDLVGGPYVQAGIALLALKGRMMLIGTIAGAESAIDLRRMLGRRLTVRGTVLRPRSVEEKCAVASAFTREVVPLLERGECRPVVDSVHDLEQIADAHRRLESNETFGKVVVSI